MRRNLSILCTLGICWVALCPGSLGQLVLNAHLAHSRVIQYEPLQVAVRIENHTSQDVALDARGAEARLLFDIEQVPGQLILPQTNAAWPSLRVPARKAVDAEINLCALYDLRRTGPYTIRPRLEWGEKSFPGPTLYADVVPGFEIGRFVEETSPGGAFRTFTLLTLNRNRGEHLFLRVEDENRRLCYSIADLGRVVRLHPPVLAVDAEGLVHVLHQAGPAQFAHTVLTPDGEVTDRQAYRTTTGAPVLERDDQGRVSVRGAEPVTAVPSGAPAEASESGAPPPAGEDILSPVRSGRPGD